MSQSSAYSRCALGTLVVVGLLGCGGGYVPPSNAAARTALTQSLTQWKNGGPPGAIDGASPPTQAADHIWQAGRKLDTFEIVREESGGEEKRFLVKLIFRGDPAPKETLYVVFGNSPIFVYAEEDYQRMINMDNNPTPGKPPKGRSR